MRPTPFSTAIIFQSASAQKPSMALAIMASTVSPEAVLFNDRYGKRPVTRLIVFGKI
jgi:hypothetical protein